MSTFREDLAFLDEPIRCWAPACVGEADGRLGMCEPCATAYEATLWDVRGYQAALAAEPTACVGIDEGYELSPSVHAVRAHAATQRILFAPLRVETARALEGWFRECSQRGCDAHARGVDPTTLTVDPREDPWR